MPPLSLKAIKSLNLIPGGKWFEDRDEAISHAGVLAEINVSPTRTVYGAYSSQESLCNHAMTFVKRHQKAPTASQFDDLIGIHSKMHQKVISLLRLPSGGYWFGHETGALTAFTLQKDVHFVKVAFEKKGEKFNWDDTSSYTTLFGIFPSVKDWVSAKENTPLPPNCHEPTHPFKTNNIRYDRVRCTLMRARGALFKPPVLKFVPEEEMLAYRDRVPHSHFWFKTKEDALDMAAYTLAYHFPEGTLYCTYGSPDCICFALGRYLDQLKSHDDPRWFNAVPCELISTPDKYWECRME